MRFAEPGPYITPEELGQFAADYRRLMAGAAAVVLCGSLPDRPACGYLRLARDLRRRSGRAGGSRRGQQSWSTPLATVPTW